MADVVQPKSAAAKIGPFAQFVAVIAACGYVAYWEYSRNHPPGPPQSPVIVSGPTTADVGRLVTITVTAPDGAEVDWTPPVAGDFAVHADGRHASYVAMTPGDETFFALGIWVDGKAAKKAKGSYTLKVGEAAPTPVPAPAPAPTPSPAPAPAPRPQLAGPFHVTLIYDDAVKTPEIAAIQASPTIRSAISAISGSMYRAAPKGDPTMIACGIDPVAVSFGLPCVIVQNVAGVVVGKFSVPASESGLVEAVKMTTRGD